MLTEKIYGSRTTSYPCKGCLLIAQWPMLHPPIARACIMFNDKQPRRSGFTYPSDPYIMEAEMSQLRAGKQSSIPNMAVFSDISSCEVQPCELINSTGKGCRQPRHSTEDIRRKEAKVVDTRATAGNRPTIAYKVETGSGFPSRTHSAEISIIAPNE